MGRARLYAQLVRLPNLPSAFGDIVLVALAAVALPDHWLRFAFLMPSSACLYCAGMVWNDYFDVEQDRRERPFRPIPSGRVTPRQAMIVGLVLLALGLAGAAVAGWTSAGWSSLPLLLAALLVAALVSY